MTEPTPDAGDNFDESLILDAIDRFLERDVRPVAHDLEASDTWPADIVESMKELGLFGATISPVSRNAEPPVLPVGPPSPQLKVIRATVDRNPTAMDACFLNPFPLNSGAALYA